MQPLRALCNAIFSAVCTIANRDIEASAHIYLLAQLGIRLLHAASHRELSEGCRNVKFRVNGRKVDRILPLVAKGESRFAEGERCINITNLWIFIARYRQYEIPASGEMIS